MRAVCGPGGAARLAGAAGATHPAAHATGLALALVGCLTGGQPATATMKMAAIEHWHHRQSSSAELGRCGCQLLVTCCVASASISPVVQPLHHIAVLHHGVSSSVAIPVVLMWRPGNGWMKARQALLMPAHRPQRRQRPPPALVHQATALGPSITIDPSIMPSVPPSAEEVRTARWRGGPTLAGPATADRCFDLPQVLAAIECYNEALAR